MKKFILLFCFFVCNVNAENLIQNNHAMLFVSLGMPKLLLRQYVMQSRKYHIPLILRGFLENNYPKTAKRIYDILHPKNQSELKGGFEIDPLYFRKYSINVVPALVIEKGGHSAIVYGNIPIHQMLSIIRAQSENINIKNEARLYLNHAERAS